MVGSLGGPAWQSQKAQRETPTMPVFQAIYAEAYMRADGKAEVRFRTKEQRSVSVTLPESALHLLGERIAGIAIPAAPDDLGAQD